MQKEEKTTALTAKELAMYLGCEVQFRHTGTVSKFIKPLTFARIEWLLNPENVDYYKLVLRQMPDLTEDELKVLNPNVIQMGLWQNNNRLESTLTGEQFTYLLSRGFDLFGYIESGRAIRKTPA